jgi:TPR repeat protein
MSRGSSSQAGTASGLNVDTLRRLAETGNAQAQWNCGVRLLSGEGLSIDMGRGAHYLKLAADQGLAEAQVSYGMCLKRDQSPYVRDFTFDGMNNHPSTVTKRK